MANLHVQPKRKNYAWVWILILILIIAGAVYYFGFYKKQEAVPTTTLVVPSTFQFQTGDIPLLRMRNAVASA